MSHCVVPKWNLRPQRQEELLAGEEGNNNNSNNNNRSPHVRIQHHHHHQNHHHLHTSDYDVAELTWENGHLAMHGFGGLQSTGAVPASKPSWIRPNDTLESIVHQATTCHMDNNNASFQQNISSMVDSSGGGSSSHAAAGLGGSIRKRTRTESDQCGRNFSLPEVERSVCASASATFCKDNDRTMMTWASFESPRSMKTKTTDEDSACHDGPENRDDDQETKGETGRSHSMRRSRAAAVHNQSERRRRDRINQKMKALQKLVPNSSKTDKASMLDEVIEYLKQLQAQIQMMNTVRNMPQMMLPMGIHQHQQQQQQQLQMSLLARMAGMGTMGLGMGMGMGMLDMTAMARTAPQSLNVAATANPAFVQSPFVMPAMIPGRASQPQPSSEASSNASVPMHDPYVALLAQQSMNMDMYNKMASLYRQQVNQTTMGTTNQPHSSHDQRS